MAPRSPRYVLAIDQGTSSTRCLIFDRRARVVARAQREHRQLTPQPGWLEHDPAEIWRNVCDVAATAMTRAGAGATDIAAIGLANQRETTLVWDRHTGAPIANAIVWQDVRTQPLCDELARHPDGTRRYAGRTGLPLASYFAGPKIAWLLDNVAGARARAEAGDLLFGTIDSWLVWNLTGGAGSRGDGSAGGGGGLHLTDVTNASRTLLMDLSSLAWCADIAGDMGIPLSMLPEIRPSSQVCGTVRAPGPLAGIPIGGVLGDQQAAMFGQACLRPGDAKSTYGTGNFVLLNTGSVPVASRHGLLTTVGYRIGDQPAAYALEGSVAVTGSLVQWLRDNLGLISSADEIEELAASVPDNGGAYLVPAFSGLFAPHWRPDARGALVGLTRFVNKGHLARAVLEATAFQTRDVIEAMNADAGPALASHHGPDAEPALKPLKVDGGMVVNSLLMQFQADILGVPVVRPAVVETTALGAAYAAGLAVGFFGGNAIDGADELRANWAEDTRWLPRMPRAERDRLCDQWTKAVSRSLDWV